MQLLVNTLALSVLYLGTTQGQNNGTRVFDGGSTSSATGTSSQGSSSMSSGLSSAESEESFSSSSSSGSSSASSSSSSSSSYSGPGLSFSVGDLLSLFSPPPSSRRTPVSGQTRPRRPPSARRQSATRRFQPRQRRQQQMSSRRFQGAPIPINRRTQPVQQPRSRLYQSIQQPTLSRRLQSPSQSTGRAQPVAQRPSTAGCSCSGLVTAGGQGECKTTWHQDGVPKAFCYTEEGKCRDQQRSPSGRYWSFKACSGTAKTTNSLVSGSSSSSGKNQVTTSNYLLPSQEPVPKPTRRTQKVTQSPSKTERFQVPSGCLCNGHITARGQGECKTSWLLDGVPKAFCYTDEGSCGDQQRSPSGRYWSFKACSGIVGTTNSLLPGSSSIRRKSQETTPYSSQPDQRLDTKSARKAPVTFQNEKSVSRSRTVSPSCSGLRPCRTPGGKCCKPLGYQGRPSCRGVNNC